MSFTKAVGNLNSVVTLLAQSVAALLPIAPIHADAKGKIATGLNDALSLLAETETLIASGIDAVHETLHPAPETAETDAAGAVDAAAKVSASATGGGAPGTGAQTFPPVA